MVCIQFFEQRILHLVNLFHEYKFEKHCTFINTGAVDTRQDLVLGQILQEGGMMNEYRAKTQLHKSTIAFY